MNEKKESKLDIFTKAVEAFGAEVEQRRKKLGPPPSSMSPENKSKQTLIKKGFLKGDPLEGYLLREGDPDLFVKATYNLHVILARLALNIGSFSFIELGKNATEIEIALLEALNIIIESGVKDEPTAQVAARICGQLVAQNKRVVERIQEKEGGRVSGIIPSALQSFMGGKDGMKIIDEVTPLIVQVLETLFDIGERRYRVEELSKKIETFKDGNLPLNNELRQELIKVLSIKSQKEFSSDGLLDEAFLTQYLKKWDEDLGELNKIKSGNLASLEWTLAIRKNFSFKRDRFENSSSSFLAKVKKLREQLALPLSESKAENPVSVAEKEITMEIAAPAPVLKEMPPLGEKTESSLTETFVEELSSEPENFEEGMKTETAPLPTETSIPRASIETSSVEELTLEDEKFSVPIKKFDELILKQRNIIEALRAQEEKLSNELKSLQSQSNNLDIEKEELSKKIASVKKWPDEEHRAVWAEHERQQEDLNTQTKRIGELRTNINAKTLALNGKTDEKDLAWLGIQDEKTLTNFLEAQKQENNDLFEKALSWWGSVLGGESTIDYEPEKKRLLANLSEADKRVVAAQEELNKRGELLSQQMSDDKQQLIQLNAQLISVENEIGTLSLKIKGTNDEKTRVGQDKELAEGQKKELEESKENLIEQERLEKERLAEQKRAEEERKNLEAAKQLEEARRLEQEAEKAKGKLIEKPPEETVASVLNEPEIQETGKTKEEHVEEPLEKTVAPALNEQEILAESNNLVKSDAVKKIVPVEEFSRELLSAGEKVNETENKKNKTREDYHKQNDIYEKAKNFPEMVSTLIALTKAWLKYQKAKRDFNDAETKLSTMIERENKRAKGENKITVDDVLKQVSQKKSEADQEAKLEERKEAPADQSEQVSNLSSPTQKISGHPSSFFPPPSRSKNTEVVLPADRQVEGKANQL